MRCRITRWPVLLLVVGLAGCTTPEDFRRRMEQAAASGGGVQQTHFAHIGEVQTANGTYHVAVQRRILTGMLAPRGLPLRLLLFDDDRRLVAVYEPDVPSMGSSLYGAKGPACEGRFDLCHGVCCWGGSVGSPSTGLRTEQSAAVQQIVDAAFDDVAFAAVQMHRIGGELARLRLGMQSDLFTAGGGANPSRRWCRDTPVRSSESRPFRRGEIYASESRLAGNPFPPTTGITAAAIDFLSGLHRGEA